MIFILLFCEHRRAGPSHHSSSCRASDHGLKPQDVPSQLQKAAPRQLWGKAPRRDISMICWLWLYHFNEFIKCLSYIRLLSYYISLYISVLFLLVKSNHAKVHDQSCESPFPAFRGRILETFLHGTSCYHRRPNSLTCKHGRGERLRAPSGPKQTCCPGIETVSTLGQIWKHRGMVHHGTSWYPGVHLGWVMLVSQILDFGWSVFFHIKLWGKSRWIIAKYCNYMGKDIRAMWGESPNFWGALSIQGLDDSNCFNDAEKTHWPIEKLDTPDLETRAFIISSTSQKSNSFQENLKSVQTCIAVKTRTCPSHLFPSNHASAGSRMKTCHRLHWTGHSFGRSGRRFSCLRMSNSHIFCGNTTSCCNLSKG